MRVFKKLLVVLLSAMLILNVSACTNLVDKNKPFVDNDEFYVIKMLMPVVSLPTKKAFQDVNRKLNELVRKEINAEVEIQYFILGEYPNQANVQVGSGTPLDLIWTNSTSYYTFLEAEALYPMNNLFNYAPTLYQTFDEQIWAQVTHSDGKIYAAPNMQILPRTAGMVVRDESLFIEYMHSVLNIEGFMDKGFEEQEAAINTYCTNRSLEEQYDLLAGYLDWLKAEDKGFGGISYGVFATQFMETFFGYDDLTVGLGVPGVVRASDTAEGGIEVFNQFKTDEFKFMIDKMVEWQKNNYIPRDITEGGYSNTNLDISPASTWKPGARTERVENGVKKYETIFKFGTPHYLQSYIQGTMWSIVETSQNPARTMKFLELLHTNKEIHNLLKYGIEDVNYKLVNEGKQASLINRSGYSMAAPSWILGNEFIGIPADFQPVDIYEQTEEINESTPISDIIGFVFDRNPVALEIQNCAAISATYLPRFEMGIDYGQDPGLYNEFLQSLDKAGAEKIIKEKQRQLNAWLAKK